MSAFEESEYVARTMRTKEEMVKRGMEILLVINEANMSYLTGYLGWSAYVPQMVVISIDDMLPRMVVRYQDAACARHSTFLTNDRIFPYSEEYIASHERSPYHYVGDLISSWGYSSKRIGVELGNSPLTPDGWMRLQKCLPHVEFVDATNLVNWIRAEKSAMEIRYMRQAAEIGDSAIREAIDNVEVGTRECDVAAKVMAAQCRGTAEFGGDRPKAPAMPSGAWSCCPHLSWRDRRYESGDTICIELAGWRYRYACAVSRTIHLGDPPERLVSIHSATKAGLEALIESIRPGILCSEVEKIFRDETGRHGWIKDSRVGYCIGIDWSEGTASIVPWDHTLLKPGMTLHLMLGMWQEDHWGYVLSETVLVTEDGAETLCKLPRELFVC